MEIEYWYKNNFESHLTGRYITLDSVSLLFKTYKSDFDISVAGFSEMGQDIPLIKIGHGATVILAWSQMHGNEATTTKAIFDFLRFVKQKQYFQLEIEQFLNDYTLYVLPILNPDGARLYTRENANGVDLNRDAEALSQKESRCLREVFEKVKPSLCLNLHDQRSIYGFANGKPATVSFLSPAANKERSLTDSRVLAMKHIVNMNKTLQSYIPGQVGRYDDTFNSACVGDTFQKEEVPTILFEAGHTRQDYQREQTREYIFYSLLTVFNIIGEDPKSVAYQDYFEIPENCKNYNDIILRNAKLEESSDTVSIAIQYREVLENETIKFVPYIDEIGVLKDKYGYVEKNANGAKILTKTQEKLTVGANISEIIDKSDDSVIIFHK